jgi:predicted nucleic acid-binding protein
VLAHLLDEQRQPPASMWSETLITSRLTHFETWVNLHARGLGASHADAARDVFARLGVVELHPLATQRALEPLPRGVRTLDALHLSAIEYLRGQRQQVTLATYDTRLAQAAEALDIPLAFPTSGQELPGTPSRG